MDPAAPSIPTGPPRKRTSERAIAVVVWLGVGAGLNVAIAWGIMVLHAAYRAAPIAYSTSSPSSVWPVEVPVSWPPPDTSSVACFRGRTFTSTSVGPLELLMVDSGWPARGVRGVSLANFSSRLNGLNAYAADTQRIIAVDLVNGRRSQVSSTADSDPGSMVALLPTLPIWPGFALNTLFYAAIAWVLWRIPILIRSQRRRGRGLCVKCAYNRAGLTPGAACPECGDVPRVGASVASA